MSLAISLDHGEGSGWELYWFFQSCEMRFRKITSRIAKALFNVPQIER